MCRLYFISNKCMFWRKMLIPSI
uniref:Uncharacterized protein n=1 Tax=Arundo donax TaxID=35708 RepID=A0A0A9A2M8_ARUDO